MGRIGRSFQLVGQSYRVLMQDKELMVLPLISGVTILAVSASAFFGLGVDVNRLAANDPVSLALMFLIYVLVYAIGIFFQAAVVVGATERMSGGDPTVRSAMAGAAARLGPILVWAILASTVGLFLRFVSERAGFLGRIVVSLVGAVWSLATFFVVPVLVLERRPVRESFTRSLSIFTGTWGETFVGGTTIGAAALVAWVTLIAVVGLLAWMQAGVLALVAGAVGAIFLLIFFSALQGVYIASLYRYATHGHAAEGFDATLLAQAFVPKR